MGSACSNCHADLNNDTSKLEAIMRPLIQQELKLLLPDIEKIVGDAFKSAANNVISKIEH